eukprot:jgi/Psemu1/16999/gm1.16999_g
MQSSATKSHDSMLNQLVGKQPVVVAPNTLDMIAFRKLLAKILAQCHHKNHDQTMGFSFPIGKKTVYMERSEEREFPSTPEKLTPPTGNMMHQELDSAAWVIIHHKSPKMLIQELYTTLTLRITNRKYTPGPHGAKEYFTDTIDDQGSIHLLGVGEKEWEASSLTSESDIEAFQRFWVKQLMDILSTKKHRGALTNYTAEVQEETGIMRSDIAYLISNKQEIVSAFNASVQEPLMQTTPAGGPLVPGSATVQEWVMALTAQVAALQAAVYSQSASTITTPGEQMGQDMETPQCPQKSKVKDFQKHITATRTDPQGGNNKRTTWG